MSTTPAVERVFEFTIDVDEATPFTVEVIVLPLESTPLLEITDDVAVTPLMVVVRVLPASD